MQLDGLPDNPARYLRKVYLFRKICVSTIRQQKRIKNKKNSVLKEFILNAIRSPLLLIDRKWLIRKFFAYCKKYSYEESRLVCNNQWYTTPTKVLEKEWFRDTVKKQFEGIQANVCIGYDEFLSKRYGEDYMKIPPKKEQITHSFKAWQK